MKDALSDANIEIDQIDYINAHGTSTPAGDEIEIKAIQEIFINKTKDISVSSTKSQTGHLLGAAGAIEAIFSILAIKYQIIPATMNLDNPLEHNKINIIKETPKRDNIRNVLSNSFGFGGTNVSLIFKKI